MNYQETKENTAKAYGSNLSISTKKSVEICNKIRGMSVVKAKRLLEQVIYKEKPIPMARYNRDTAHKKTMAAGKYPVNAAASILKLIKSAEANAQHKGLSQNLVVAHIAANQASRPWRFGRQRRRKMKRTHIEIVLQEKK
jgi:large subunit ribosomal protein L22